MERRRFIRNALVGTCAVAVWAPEKSESSQSDFTFVHFTDTHIQPERRAAQGCSQCFRQINAMKPEFAVAGGDLVMDALGVGSARATQLYDLYAKTLRGLEMPVYTAIGNHDVFGLLTRSGVQPTDPLYGKKMYEDRIGKRYYSFNHKGWHFIVLDSIGATKERDWFGQIDDVQLDWLKSDLKAAGKRTPILVTTHIPLVTGFLHYALEPNQWTTRAAVANTRDVLRLLEGYNVKAVLQGHNHVCEIVEYKRCQFITTGAVCGNWWRGPLLGHPEGYALLKVVGESIHWSYHSYGFMADPPPENRGPGPA